MIMPRPVTIVHSADYLLEESSCIFFLQLSVFYNVVKQLPTRYILHHHEDVSGGADHLVQLDNVGVSE